MILNSAILTILKVKLFFIIELIIQLANSVDVLILHGRNTERLRQSEKEVRNVSNNPNLEIHTVLGDLASLKDIREIAR